MEANNKLIAEFMQKGSEGFGFYDFDGCHYRLDELKFHTSWDWLMPVVMKISRKTDKPLDEVVSRLTEVGSDNIWGVKSLHNAVVEFINEYNQKNQQDER